MHIKNWGKCRKQSKKERYLIIIQKEQRRQNKELDYKQLKTQENNSKEKEKEKKSQEQ